MSALDPHAPHVASEPYDIHLDDKFGHVSTLLVRVVAIACKLSSTRRPAHLLCTGADRVIAFTAAGAED